MSSEALPVGAAYTACTLGALLGFKGSRQGCMLAVLCLCCSFLPCFSPHTHKPTLAPCLHPCSDPVVPLVERAVHPLFLAAVSQIEVEMEGRGRVKLGDLYTHEVSQTLEAHLTGIG